MSLNKSLTPYIEALLSNPPTLTPSQFSKALEHIFKGESNDIEASSFLTALKLRKLDFNSDYISTAVSKILQFSDSINHEALDATNGANANGSAATGDISLDIVGTGGDKQNTFNVSTSAAIIASGIPGLKVVKHGGKASTSNSGSGDLMKHLGVDLLKVNAGTAVDIINDSNLCFLFAPAFHHGMASVVNLRKSLGVPTIFNILGPLLNPVNVKGRILGVYTEELGKVYCEAAVKLDLLKGNSAAETMVVWGEVGLDEISPIGKTKVWKYNTTSKEIDEFELKPSDFGLPEHSLDLVRSGTPEENAIVLNKILNNEVSLNVGADPLVDYILMNAGALCVVGGVTDDWKTGVQLARESVKSGSAKEALKKFIDSIDKYSD